MTHNQVAESANSADVRAQDNRWFYVDACTPHGVVYCGKVRTTERAIRDAFPGCSIRRNGTVSVWRAPNDTRDSMHRIPRSTAISPV